MMPEGRISLVVVNPGACSARGHTQLGAGQSAGILEESMLVTVGRFLQPLGGYLVVAP